MSDNRNMDLEEQLSILFDDIDDSAKKAESAKKAAEDALDQVADAAGQAKDEVPVFTEIDDAFTAAKNEAGKAAEAAAEVKPVRESTDGAASQEAVFVEADIPERSEAPAQKKQAAQPVKEAAPKAAAADDTKIKSEEYKGIDFDSFESVIGDDDDEDALVPEDIPQKQKRDLEADEEFEDDDEDDEDELGGKKPARREAPKRTRQKDTASAEKRKESAKFWIFTAIVALIVAAAVLFILWSRGIIGGGREAQPSSQEPVVTDDTAADTDSEADTESQTESVSETEPASESEEETEPASESDSEEETEPEAEGSVTNQDVLDNYANPFMVTGTGTLNVREQPGAEGKIIGTIDEFGGGELVSDAGNGWFSITSGGISGYVSGQFIAGLADITDIIAEHAVQQVRIHSENGVNIRSAASTDAEAIDQAGDNTLWEFLGEEEGFYHIRYDDDTEGYVSKDYSEVGWFLKEAVPYYE